ncbi:MAG TPA: hypothetical protein PLQ47_10420 [Candidatus Marinimicrobia bacterium]|nr:hypothetical protein [Candidatus Neomarinimicrobiota bacterium]
MDIATIFGIIAGTVLIIMGISGLTSDFKIFWDLSSVFIVVGGSFASTMISFSVKEVFSLIGSIIAVFKKEKIKMTDEVETIVELATVARKSVQDLEKALVDVQNPFLRDGLQMVVDGYNPRKSVIFWKPESNIGLYGSEAKPTSCARWENIHRLLE